MSRLVHLSPRERFVACVYAEGQPASKISLQTSIAPATIYKYIARVRRRCVDAGRPAPSKLALRQRLS